MSQKHAFTGQRDPGKATTLIARRLRQQQHARRGSRRQVAAQVVAPQRRRPRQIEFRLVLLAPGIRDILTRIRAQIFKQRVDICLHYSSVELRNEAVFT